MLKLLIYLLFTAEIQAANLDQFLNALGEVESGNNASATGDGGKAVGVFQIHEVYWKDAIQFDKSIGGKYTDCFKPDYSRKIVLAYFRRYAINELNNNNWEALARLHNSGPNWKKKKEKTNKYWAKIRAKLT